MQSTRITIHFITNLCQKWRRRRTTKPVNYGGLSFASKRNLRMHGNAVQCSAMQCNAWLSSATVPKIGIWKEGRTYGRKEGRNRPHHEQGTHIHITRVLLPCRKSTGVGGFAFLIQFSSLCHSITFGITIPVAISSPSYHTW